MNHLGCHRFTQMKHRSQGWGDLLPTICVCLPAGRQVCAHLWLTPPLRRGICGESLLRPLQNVHGLSHRP